MDNIHIRIDDLSDSRIADFLNEHLQDLNSVSPPESTYALNLQELKQSEITFWSVWDNENLVGCGALKELSDSHAEIKSMRVASTCRSKGVASGLLAHILREAKKRGYIRVSLETGTVSFFTPAHNLYKKFGFKETSPFANYKEGPHSVFMTLDLNKA